ncbi:MAG: HNH endonuclease [Hydrococcus sp. C42_A2020_068]|uniref:HNH endonuclease n=1 Tax=Pleurocapsa sp. PCC 7327 TaxID=118163 RepID=UPI00029F84FD|nr:HNH endonuclease signature motif containing protein [Pleurocapsa sp. PCC 7327]AFY78629.1 hypothetical protein Ple7327_3421 [Pleurocapsa sp. PCC 7327]MBF2018664.1 HNH endonuclease [Hydrococcus sp. C42_A2020_068]
MTSWSKKASLKADKLSRNAARFYSTIRDCTQHQRALFEQWRDSEDGKKFKQQQLEKLGYICPVCGEDTKFGTIDHLEPLSYHYTKALDTSNLLVMCWDCNYNKKTTPFKQWRTSLPAIHRPSLDYAIALIHGKSTLQKLLTN